MEMIVAVFALLGMFGLAALILWIRDRQGAVGGVVQMFLGGVALLIGVLLVAWIVYNIFHPTEAFRQSFKSPLQFILPVGFIIVGWKWLRDKGPGIEKQNIDFTAPELTGALSLARKTLPGFIAEVGKNIDGAYVKFPFTTDEEVVEHIWAYVHSYRDGRFNVSIVNQPYTQRAPITSRRDVSEADVEDWQIMLSDGRIKGAFSYIGAFKYLERKKVRLNATLRSQKRQLVDLDVSPQDGAGLQQGSA